MTIMLENFSNWRKDTNNNVNCWFSYSLTFFSTLHLTVDNSCLCQGNGTLWVRWSWCIWYCFYWKRSSRGVGSHWSREGRGSVSETLYGSRLCLYLGHMFTWTHLTFVFMAHFFCNDILLVALPNSTMKTTMDFETQTTTHLDWSNTNNLSLYLC